LCGSDELDVESLEGRADKGDHDVDGESQKTAVRLFRLGLSVRVDSDYQSDPDCGQE